MYYYVNGEEIFISKDEKPFAKGSEGILYERNGKLYKIYYKEVYERRKSKIIHSV